MKRSDSIQRLRDRTEPFDLLIAGGGATGLGAALDAASRGHSVALFEREDFAHGTSSRSTKLIHGGVRYLRQGNIALVREALRERALLHRNAPHLVSPLDFIIPCVRHWQLPWYGIGLKSYDALAGSLGMAPSRIVGRKRAISLLPGLATDGIKGGVIYQDGQFDDARLAVTLAQRAAAGGAVVLNRFRCDSLLKAGGQVCGVMATDTTSGEVHEIRARCVINATGVFSDTLRRKDDPSTRPMIAASQGAHLVLPAGFFPGARALMVPDTDDGRVFFAVPWHGRVVIGTTDTPVSRISSEPVALEEEVDFLLRHACRFFTRKPSVGDVTGAYAGLRPLLARGGAGRTSALSRDHAIECSPSGLITITGGKWTTYRKMAEDVVDAAERQAGLERRPCVTRELALHEGDAGLPAKDDPLRVYGTDAARIRGLAQADPDLARPVHPRLPLTRAEVVWHAREEMALSVEDVLSRRSRCLVLDARTSCEAATEVAAILAGELGWSPRKADESAEAFRSLAESSMSPVFRAPREIPITVS